MKTVYLRDDTGESWLAFRYEGLTELSQEFTKRNIVVGDESVLGNGCWLGGGCWLGNGCVLGGGCRLGNGCTILC